MHDVHNRHNTPTRPAFVAKRRVLLVREQITLPRDRGSLLVTKRPNAPFRKKTDPRIPSDTDALEETVFITF